MKRFARCLLAFSISTLSHPLNAMSYVMMKDQDLRFQSSSVLTATVASSRSEAGETFYELNNVSYLRGQVATGKELLVLPGAFAELSAIKAGSIAQVTGMPKLPIGQKLMLFAVRRADGMIQPMQLLLGLFLEKQEASLRWYDRALGESEMLKTDNAQFASLRDASAFENWAKNVEEPSTDYLRPGWKELRAPMAKYTLLRAGNNDPVRWFKFAGGQTENWFATQAGMAGAAANVFTSVNNAVSAWRNDAASVISYTYVGTVASDPGNDSPNNVSAVIFDDPGNDIAGAFNCGTGGTLAIGGPWFSGASTPFAGQNMRTASEGFVITQEGAACFFDGHAGADGAETLAHEVGHTLGFGHACGDTASPTCASSTTLDDATMRAFAHGDGRGAVLRQDDRDAAFFLYPGQAVVDLIFANRFE